MVTKQAYTNFQHFQHYLNTHYGKGGSKKNIDADIEKFVFKQVRDGSKSMGLNMPSTGKKKKNTITTYSATQKGNEIVYIKDEGPQNTSYVVRVKYQNQTSSTPATFTNYRIIIDNTNQNKPPVIEWAGANGQYVEIAPQPYNSQAPKVKGGGSGNTYITNNNYNTHNHTHNNNTTYVKKGWGWKQFIAGTCIFLATAAVSTGLIIGAIKDHDHVGENVNTTTPPTSNVGTPSTDTKFDDEEVNNQHGGTEIVIPGKDGEEDYTVVIPNNPDLNGEQPNTGTFDAPEVEEKKDLTETDENKYTTGSTETGKTSMGETTGTTQKQEETKVPAGMPNTGTLDGFQDVNPTNPELGGQYDAPELNP